MYAYYIIYIYIIYIHTHTYYTQEHVCGGGETGASSAAGQRCRLSRPTGSETAHGSASASV